jgi:hypothetical protein
MRDVLRTALAGLAAALAWLLGIQIVFGPAQALLADPSRQSAKFLAAFSEEPLPRMAEMPWALPAGILVIGMIFAAVYSWLEPKLGGPTWRKGIAFGIAAWALMVPWFEFYLPWNVLREPFALVLVECACWLLVLILVGLAAALAYAAASRRHARPV